MAILPTPSSVTTTLPLPTPSTTPMATPLVPRDDRDDKNKSSPASTGHYSADGYQRSTAAKTASADSRNTVGLDDPTNNAKHSKDLNDDLSAFDPHAELSDTHASAAADHADAGAKADAKATTDRKTTDKKETTHQGAANKDADKARDTKAGDNKEAAKGKETATSKDPAAAGAEGKAAANGEKSTPVKADAEAGKTPPTGGKETPAQAHAGQGEGAQAAPQGEADKAKLAQSGDKAAEAKKNDDAQAAARQQASTVNTPTETPTANKPLQSDAEKLSAQAGSKEGVNKEQQEGQVQKQPTPHGASQLGEAKAKGLPPSKLVNPAEQKAATTATTQQAALAHAAARKDGGGTGPVAGMPAPQASKANIKSAGAESTSGKDVERQAAAGSTGPKKTDTAEANAVHAKDDISDEASGTSASD